MILKKLKRTNFRKTKAAMIGGLVDYILAKQDEDGYKKSAYAYGFNFVTSTTKGWKWEMTSLAEESVQSKMPVAHWVMSWPEDEHPSKEQVIEATNIFLERMGLSGHQAIIAAHQNTDNFHVHIAVNRTHPVTLKVIQPHRGFDINAAHRIVAEISEKQGWSTNPHARYTVDRQGKPRPVRHNDELIRANSNAAEMESFTGEKSAQRIAQEIGRSIIQQAETWKELHEKLADSGLRFTKKGSGAVIFVGDTAVKASSVDRKFGLSTLCKRLGEYEDGDYPQAPLRRAPEPLIPICAQEWYEHQELQQEKGIARHEAKEQKKAAQEALKQEQRQERKRVLAALAGHGLPLLNIARHLLKEKQRQIDTPPRLAASLTASTVPALPPFRTWLRKKDKKQADIWRCSRTFTKFAYISKLLAVHKSNMQSDTAYPFQTKAVAACQRLILQYTEITGVLRELLALYLQDERKRQKLRERQAYLETAPARLKKIKAEYDAYRQRLEEATPTVHQNGMLKIQLEWHKDGKKYTDKNVDDIKGCIREGIHQITRASGIKSYIGTYRGFEVSMLRTANTPSGDGFQLVLKDLGEQEYQPDNLIYDFEENFSLSNMFQQLDNFLDKKMKEAFITAERLIKDEESEIVKVRAALRESFPHQHELSWVQENRRAVMLELQRMQDDPTYVSSWEPSTRQRQEAAESKRMSF